MGGVGRGQEAGREMERRRGEEKKTGKGEPTGYTVTGAGEGIKRFPCLHGDTSLDPHYPCKN